MATNDKLVWTRYKCPACKGTGYVKPTGFIKYSDKDIPAKAVFDKVCCDACRNGFIEEWIPFKDLLGIGNEKFRMKGGK